MVVLQQNGTDDGEPNSDVKSNQTGVELTSSLADLQNDEQRRVLDTVAQVRKCGLESVLSLPQLVVCGDQSAGKSSVLEALTEIPFPRNDNLCTRFATEIILRRAPVDSLTIRLIPDSNRPASEQATIRSFAETISDFQELPRVMDEAMAVMGLGSDASSSVSTSTPKAFARDVLSIEIEGPLRPQLTLVDIPGLIQTETKGVTKADIDLVMDITDQYISNPRTICLAVVSASNDYANQKILTKVREVDPDGDRTLGIITKPDRLPAGSGSEKAFLELARNEDIFFKLGWHVLKNRAFEEGASSLIERNLSESIYFSTSNFKTLPNESVGIDALRDRLSKLLFEHVKQELPKLWQDLRDALANAEEQRELMGTRRSTSSECKAYLNQLSLDYYEICKAAVNGSYEGDYFSRHVDNVFSVFSPNTIRRLRAVIQFMNSEFTTNFRTAGHKYRIAELGDSTTPFADLIKAKGSNLKSPIELSKSQSLEWVSQVLARTRGRELVGNFNPLLIGELFWEQCSRWEQLARDHVDRVAQKCSKFLDILLVDTCPKDVKSRLWSSQIQDVLNNRHKEALGELKLIVEDLRSYPINYNHYYTDTITQRREERQKEILSESLEKASRHEKLDGCHSTHKSTTVDINQVLKSFSTKSGPDMERFSCEEALDCLFAIYKVTNKVFIANVTTQVIERHVVRGLEKIFSPLVVGKLSDTAAIDLASEPISARRQRDFLEDRIKKLENGSSIFRNIMGGALD